MGNELIKQDILQLMQSKEQILMGLVITFFKTIRGFVIWDKGEMMYGRILQSAYAWHNRLFKGYIKNPTQLTKATSAKANSTTSLLR